MKNQKKAIPAGFLLAAALLTAVSCGFTSCGAEGQKPSETAAASLPAETDEQTEEGLHDSLPAMDFGGADFRIWGDISPITYAKLYDVGDDTADVMDEAVWKRNHAVEDRFNVKLAYDLEVQGANGWRSDGEKNSLIASVMAGDGICDLYTSVILYSSNAVMSGCFRNLLDAEYLDFDAPWWMPYLNDIMTISGKRFTASGYFDMPTLMRGHAVYFSTKLVNQYDLGNLYEYVDNGTWTFDKMIELGKIVARDVDGDGKPTENDCYGITSQWDVLGGAYWTTGNDFYTKDADGNLSALPATEGLINANTLLYELTMKSPDLYYSGYTKGKEHNYENMVNVFTDNRALFFVNGMNYCSDPKFREMGDYGLLPLPKFTVEQENYGNSVSHYSTAIPIDAKDVTMSEVIWEALNYETYMTVRPAYFNIALSAKYLNDPDSVRVLDIIFSNVHTNTDYMFGVWGTPVFQGLIGYSENLASEYEKKFKTLEKRGKEISETFASLGNAD